MQNIVAYGDEEESLKKSFFTDRPKLGEKVAGGVCCRELSVNLIIMLTLSLLELESSYYYKRLRTQVSKVVWWRMKWKHPGIFSCNVQPLTEDKTSRKVLPYLT